MNEVKEQTLQNSGTTTDLPLCRTLWRCLGKSRGNGPVPLEPGRSPFIFPHPGTSDQGRIPNTAENRSDGYAAYLNRLSPKLFHLEEKTFTGGRSIHHRLLTRVRVLWYGTIQYHTTQVAWLAT
jgi:hypothetical protein